MPHRKWEETRSPPSAKKVRPMKWLDFELNPANLEGFWRENGGMGWSRENLGNLDG